MIRSELRDDAMDDEAEAFALIARGECERCDARKAAFERAVVPRGNLSPAQEVDDSGLRT